jgi:hypothetical protein
MDRPPSPDYFAGLPDFDTGALNQLSPLNPRPDTHLNRNSVSQTPSIELIRDGSGMQNSGSISSIFGEYEMIELS